MVERLIIKNFVGIKSIDIELNKLNILIGPQASGKSICAKLLFYFKNFVWDLLSTVENKHTKRQLDSAYSKKFEEYFPADSWGNSNFMIRYEIADTFIEVSRSYPNSTLIITYSEFYKKELATLRKIASKIEKKQFDNSENEYEMVDRMFEIRKQMINHLTSSLGSKAAFSQLFIPAGRSFFANLQNSIFSFLSSNNALDPFIKTFGLVYENMKNSYYRMRRRNSKNKELQEEIDKLVEKTLCGKHIYEKGKDLLEITDGRRVGIANCSSGQQETLPLAIILATLPFLSAYSTPGRTVYIEEPEAHLFPSAQRNIIELISTVFNARQEHLQFFITTHSPYVLTAINNLLQAGLLYKESSPELLEKLRNIVPEYKSLLPADLAAYSLVNGNCKTIVCSETGLIDTNVIDAVSDELAIQFDELLNLA
jgi:predicted ATP-binding protein involved in virulence